MTEAKKRKTYDSVKRRREMKECVCEREGTKMEGERKRGRVGKYYSPIRERGEKYR